MVMNSRARQELVKFLMVGSSTVVIDYLSYVSLLYVGVSIPVAKMIGFIVGTTFAYFANRFWTFNARETEKSTVGPFVVVYAVSLAVNVGVNQAILLWANLPYLLTIAFVIATGISATMNFLGMKFFVFNVHPPTEG